MLDQQERDIAAEQLRRFAVQFAGMRIQSTSAQVVTYTGGLYNVIGSTPDPKIGGQSWKTLLQSNGISGNCYADTPAAPGGTSHPGFSVGGHVTPNADGSVPDGGQCYLMPLCYWHNGSANNGQLFQHGQTQMLQLSGYMQGEPAATFLARMVGEAPLSLVFVGNHGLSYRNVHAAAGDAADTLAAINGPAALADAPFVLLRRHSDDDTVTYTIAEARV